MTFRAQWLLGCLFSCIFALGAVQAADEDDLRTVFVNALEDMRERDLEGFLSHWDSEAVLLFRNRMFPIDRAESDFDEWAATARGFFDRTISAEFRVIDLKFRVFGDTGLVWGLGRFSVDSGEGGYDHDSRLTAVFAKRAGEWKIVNWHASAVPAGPEHANR